MDRRTFIIAAGLISLGALPARAAQTYSFTVLPAWKNEAKRKDRDGIRDEQR